MNSLAVRAIDQAYTDSQVGTTNTTVAANTAAITANAAAIVATSGTTPALTGAYTYAFTNFFPVADNTDQAVFSISVTNVACGGGLRLFVSGTLGDGDSTSTKEYFIAVSRIAGAATLAAIGSAVGAAATTGASFNAATTATLGAATGATSATQTIAINVKVARSGGTATNHRISAFVELMSSNGTAMTVG